MALNMDPTAVGKPINEIGALLSGSEIGAAQACRSINHRKNVLDVAALLPENSAQAMLVINDVIKVVQALGQGGSLQKDLDVAHMKPRPIEPWPAPSSAVADKAIVDEIIDIQRSRGFIPAGQPYHDRQA